MANKIHWLFDSESLVRACHILLSKENSLDRARKFVFRTAPYFLGLGSYMLQFERWRLFQVIGEVEKLLDDKLKKLN